MILELLFKNEAGKNRKINIQQPKNNITAQEAYNALNNIVNTEIFIDEDGDLYNTIVGARYVSRIVENIYMEE